MTFEYLKGEVRLNEPMSAHTSFRIGGNADAFVVPSGAEDLVRLLQDLRRRDVPSIVLGGGTNVLVKDGGFRGVVISLERLNAMSVSREYRAIGGSFAVIRVEAGAPLPKLVKFAEERGFAGLEFAAGIPGTVGGAVCMNAGTAQGEMGDVVDTVTLISPSGEQVIRHRNEMGFGYRASNIPPGHAVVEAKIILRLGDREKIHGTVRAALDQRKARQPLGLPNAGSVFKNPLDEAAGKLIETAGLKGLTVGRAQISEKHANFIVNLGGATASDVLKLMEVVKDRVLEIHKVRLEPEIKIVGED